ncbi:hypothetical protein [Nonomuraea wenchangensis]|uniref:hypothetical protein n=1 Tax=Nonomuraea wenchangensis TaxID=568860 RepID=UPI001FE4EF83|nr:hypothetical protein [Nonomuraea wenchangensis]
MEGIRAQATAEIAGAVAGTGSLGGLPLGAADQVIHSSGWVRCPQAQRYGGAEVVR